MDTPWPVQVPVRDEEIVEFHFPDIDDTAVSPPDAVECVEGATLEDVVEFETGAVVQFAPVSNRGGYTRWNGAPVESLPTTYA
jgi:hypothetical protein